MKTSIQKVWLTKLAQVSRYLWLYSILFVFGFSFKGRSAPLVLTELHATQTLMDSIPADTSRIDTREFQELKEKYQGDDFIYDRTIENSGWWTRFKQWLSDLFKDLFNLNSAGQASRMTDVALKIAGVIIFLLVIYFIFRAVMNDEGTWVFGKSSDKKIIPVTDIETNIHTTDFRELIADAEKEGNYRLAIRYYYLWLLKTLTHAEMIAYDVEKTNSDYFNEIASKEIKDEFSYLSYLYNYIWYGEFDVNEQQFTKAKTAFNKFINSLKAWTRL